MAQELEQFRMIWRDIQDSAGDDTDKAKALKSWKIQMAKFLGKFVADESAAMKSIQMLKNRQRLQAIDSPGALPLSSIPQLPAPRIAVDSEGNAISTR